MIKLALRPADSWDEQRAHRFDTLTRLAAGGVRMLDPSSVYVDPTVTVGAGTLLLPGTILRGNTVIGKNCEIGPNTQIVDCTIGDGCHLNSSQLFESVLEDNITAGPFAYVRPNCHVAQGVKIGDFVELKNSTIGAGTKVPHLTYVGDSDVGEHVNFGCGTVTVNYDGTEKHRCTVGDNAFLGCNTNLVAPVTVGAGAFTAAGSTITSEVPADSLAVARARQIIKPDWAKKRKTRS
ncbi:MAG: UDP-N-acetylglucosamine diphosphorylase [Oscillospiraceae bacterium]